MVTGDRVAAPTQRDEKHGTANRKQRAENGRKQPERLRESTQARHP
jgi:hypothetical protein